MVHVAQLRRTFVRSHTPAGCGTLDKHLSCRGARGAHAKFTGETHRRTAAGDLHIHQFRNLYGADTNQAFEKAWHAEFTGEALNYIAIGEQIDRRRLFDIDQLPIGIELIGSHHGQRGVHALSHFGMGHVDGDRIVDFYLQERGDIVLAALRQFGVRQSVSAGSGRRVANQYTTANQGRGDQETSSAYFFHG